MSYKNKTDSRVCVAFIAGIGHTDVCPACSHVNFRNFQPFVDFRSCSFGIWHLLLYLRPNMYKN